MGTPTSTQSNAEVAAEMNSAVGKVLSQIGDQVAQYLEVAETQLDEARKAVGGKESVLPAITGLEANIEAFRAVIPKLAEAAPKAEQIRTRVLA